MPTELKPTLAFIDDDERILRAMQRLFRDTHTVFITTEPDAYIDYIRFNPVHVAVSDQRMPQRLGVDILREVKDLSPLTMRILMTGYADLEAIISSINEGEIFRYLVKPCKSEEIKAIVEQATHIAQSNFAQVRATTTMPIPLETDYLTTMVGILNEIEGADYPEHNDGLDPTPNMANGSADMAGDFAPLTDPNTPVSTDTPVTLTPALTSTHIPTQDLEKLLLIDDNPKIKQLVEQQFANKYHILYASTLEQAYEYFTQYHIGVCITDVMVKGENITPIIYTLKQNNPSLVVLVQTEFQDGATLIELINRGQIFRCLPKPIRPSLLDVSVIRAFEYHHKLQDSHVLAQRHSVAAIPDKTLDASLTPTLKKLVGKLRMKFA